MVKINYQSNHDSINLDWLIGVTCNRRIKNDKYFVVLHPVTIELSNGETIHIPDGFRFDGSSSPKWLRGVFPTYGAMLLPALIHDWLYITDHKRNEIGTRAARKFADREMFLWSQKTNPNKIDNKLRFWAVRIFGKNVYIR